MLMEPVTNRLRHAVRRLKCICEDTLIMVTTFIRSLLKRDKICAFNKCSSILPFATCSLTFKRFLQRNLVRLNERVMHSCKV